MRLIDADMLLKVYEGIEDDDLVSVGVVAQTIKYFPTSYDPDKVVEQLESFRKHEEEMHAYSSVYALNKAIEIVKGGAE